MFRRPSTLPIVVCLLAVMACSMVVQSTPSFTVELRKIEDPLEACSHLKLFLSSSSSPEKRCEKYGQMLFQYNGGIEYRKMMEVAKKDADQDTWNKLKKGEHLEMFRRILNRLLRKEANQMMNAALLDMYECLRAAARVSKSFRASVNNVVLKTVYDQYTALLKQSVWILYDTKFEGTLPGEQLTLPVEMALELWLDDSKDLARIFPETDITNAEQLHDYLAKLYWEEFPKDMTKEARCEVYAATINEYGTYNDDFLIYLSNLAESDALKNDHAMQDVLSCGMIEEVPEIVAEASQQQSAQDE